MRRDGWKLIEPYEPNRAVELTNGGAKTHWMNEPAELFDVLRDPFERAERMGRQAAIAGDLRESLDHWWPLPAND